MNPHSLRKKRGLKFTMRVKNSFLSLIGSVLKADMNSDSDEADIGFLLDESIHAKTPEKKSPSIEEDPAFKKPHGTVRERKSVPISSPGNSEDPIETPSVLEAASPPSKKKKTRNVSAGSLLPAPKKRKHSETVSNPEPAKKGGAKKSKKQEAVEQFVLNTLPALRKNMKQAKIVQSTFKVRDQSHYFAPNSIYIPTFILPLFQFLAKEEIVCSKVADFDGKKFVKTTAGFLHATFIANQALDLEEDDVQYLMRKYGKEWFKIPSKDFVKASSASKYGDKGEFKVTLIGIYEDSFKDEENHELYTINPILRYDPVVAKPVLPAAQREKKEKAVVE